MKEPYTKESLEKDIKEAMELSSDIDKVIKATADDRPTLATEVQLGNSVIDVTNIKSKKFRPKKIILVHAVPTGYKLNGVPEMKLIRSVFRFKSSKYCKIKWNELCLKCSTLKVGTDHEV